MSNRLSADSLFMMAAVLWGERSTCLRAKVGAVIVSNRRIISTGYVGAPPGEPHCIDVGCLPGPDGGCVRTIHAEANAIAFAARNGVRLEGASIYCTHTPCRPCAQVILSSGIREVVFREAYRDEAGGEILKLGHVKLRIAEIQPWSHPYLGYQSSECILCTHRVEEHSR